MAMYAVAILPLMSLETHELLLQKWCAHDVNPRGFIDDSYNLLLQLQNFDWAVSCHLAKFHFVVKLEFSAQATKLFANMDVEVVESLGSVIGFFALCQEYLNSRQSEHYVLLQKLAKHGKKLLKMSIKHPRLLPQAVKRSCPEEVSVGFQ